MIIMTKTNTVEIERLVKERNENDKIIDELSQKINFQYENMGRVAEDEEKARQKLFKRNDKINEELRKFPLNEVEKIIVRMNPKKKSRRHC